MSVVVLDSYSIIAYLEREPGFKVIARLFEECMSKDQRALLCVVNWGEVLYHALAVSGEKMARLAEEAMLSLPITLVAADQALTRQAAYLKANHKMSYADCFAAALAIKEKGELLTGDKEFIQVQKRVKIRWL